MRNRYRLLTTVSILAVFSAAATARAGEAEDLKAQVQQLTQQIQSLQAQQSQLQQRVDENTQATAKQAAAQPPQPAKGPLGSFLIPGTNTTMKIGGYIKLDATDDISGANLNGTVVDLQSIPINGTVQAHRRGDFNLTARQSRLNIGTDTPTEYGPLKAFVEGDFYGSNSTAYETNSASFRLRQAYMSWGRVLAGQSWTLFDDVEVAPETLDFGGPAGIAYGLRQAQVRYTMPVGSTGTLAVAVENPEGDFFGADHGSFITAGSQVSASVLNQLPDLTARYVYKDSWGRLSLAGVVREINLDTGGKAVTFLGPNGNFNYAGNDTLWGGGAMATAQFPTFGKDTLTVWAGGGPGLGRYLLQLQDEAFTVGQAPNGATNANPGSGAAVGPDGQLHAITAMGGNVWYRHYWMDTLRSNVTVGAVHYSNPHEALPLNVTRDIESVHANLIWSPLPQTNFGIEYIYGHIGLDGQTTANKALGYGKEGSMNRIQLSAQYLF